MRWILWIWLPAILLVARGAEAAMETEQVRGLLEKMQAEEAWGEAVFTDGRVRSLRVQEIEADSVAVVEVVGALQEREAAYALWLNFARCTRWGRSAFSRAAPRSNSQGPGCWPSCWSYPCRARAISTLGSINRDSCSWA